MSDKGSEVILLGGNEALQFIGNAFHHCKALVVNSEEEYASLVRGESCRGLCLPNEIKDILGVVPFRDNRIHAATAFMGRTRQERDAFQSQHQQQSHILLWGC